MPKLTKKQKLAKKRQEEMRDWLTCEEKAKIRTEKVSKRMNEGTLYRDTMWSFNILSDEGEWQSTCDCCLPIDIIPCIDELIILRKQT